MKATNNINADLKDEITRLLDKNTKLQIQVDDADDILRDQLAKVKGEMQGIIDLGAEGLEDLQNRFEDKEKELANFKQDYNFKMQ